MTRKNQCGHIIVPDHTAAILTQQAETIVDLQRAATDLLSDRLMEEMVAVERVMQRDGNILRELAGARHV